MHRSVILRQTLLAWLLVSGVFTSVARPLAAEDANRLTYLDSFLDPYYVSGEFPKLTTPQWVGEPGVEAVIVLAIDDMRNTATYEAYLRPILDRLKQIDGRAPVSIMTNQVPATDPRLAGWLKEGLNFDVHTIDHPCPLLQKSDFPQAQRTYHNCVDLLASIPGNRPVAFRMPCCDSLNTPSPRFWTEIFSHSTQQGHFLTIDSSVFNVITPRDLSLPREWVIRPDGRERFSHYIPFPSFVNTIDDYPYPYLIGRTCWEFPCVVPSDWAAQHVQKPNNPDTVRDMKIALDVVVKKQGVYNLVFHPHGWIRSAQVIEIIDHAVARYGNKVKFLNFREAAERLQKHLLLDQPLRAEDGSENGVRLLDINQDGYLDLLIANNQVQQTRIWSPAEKKWQDSPFPTDLRGPATRFGIQDEDLVAIRLTDTERQGWSWQDNAWSVDPALTRGLEQIFTAQSGVDQGFRLRDTNGDGRSEVIVANEDSQQIFQWSDTGWVAASLSWPTAAWIVDNEGRDAGLRFVDVDEDGFDDLLFSNEQRYSLTLWNGNTAGKTKAGWSIEALASTREAGDAIPMVSRQGTNNGAWFHSSHIWVQNEDTAQLADLVERRSFLQLLEPLHGDMPPAKSPAQALRTMRVPAAFKIELVASEPLVNDPIGFDWGIDGSLWVVEMGDYPLGSDGMGSGGGRVKHLIDTDGDGSYDQADLFLDKIPFPTGIKVFGGGILVSTAPDVFYAEDTDGDGKADRHEILYSGFAEGNQQHRVNGLRWGLDNWLYLANGDSGGRIHSIRTDETLSISGRDLRIRPDSGAMDAVSGPTQFGRNRDDWGNWFGGNNSNPMWHYVLEDYVLRRNPHVAAPPIRKQVADQPGAAPVFPTSRTLTRFNDFDRANRFTSACSPIVYRDSFLQELVGQAFVCEPVHNLVHRHVMRRDGVSFASSRVATEEQSEFLTSSDNWFRPTMIRTGPDGALWIADMYRMVIEHPKWIPANWQRQLDLRAGHDRGRIYRITRLDDQRTPAAAATFDDQDSMTLLKQLQSTSGWRRDTAQEMLVRKNDPETIAPLQLIAITSSTPLGRLHALCTLDGMGSLKSDILATALRDKHAGVRRHAVRLASQFDDDEIQRLVTSLSASEADAPVQMQIAITLGHFDSPLAGQALGRMAVEHAEQTYLYAACVSSIQEDNLADVMQGALAGDEAPPGQLLEDLLAISAAVGNQGIVSTLLVNWTAKAPYEPWQIRAVATTLSSLQQRKRPTKQLLNDDALAGIQQMIQQLQTDVMDAELPLESRREMIGLLAFANPDNSSVVAILEELLKPQRALELQSAAITATLAYHTDGATRLLKQWASISPTLRTQLVNELILDPQQAIQLLQSIEQGLLPAGHLDARQRQQLSGHMDKSIATLAARILATSGQSDRGKVLAAHRPVLTLAGDAERGRLLYRKNCATCHRLDDFGTTLGPDLAALKVRTPQALLTAMLDPNQAVEVKFLEYIALTTDGRQPSGILSRETTTDITLQAPEGKQFVILRKDIDLLRTTGKSLMPDGIEKDLSHQDLADLIRYLQGQGPPPKSFPGNTPALVRPHTDSGTLELTASVARIYGREIRFEGQYGNLGFWGSDVDRAEWTVELPKAGEYEVRLDFACAAGVAGDSFILQHGRGTLKGTVPSTGTWDKYEKKLVGKIQLPTGSSEFVFRSDGPPHGYLIDLRAIILTPIP